MRRAATKANTRMKPVLTALLSLSIILSLPAAEESPFKSTKEKASYALGMTIGKQIRQIGAEIDAGIYMKALQEAMSGGKPLMTDEQARETLMALQAEARTKTLEKNKKDGETFLAENKKKEGVVTTASGLQYKIETKGTGKIPKSNDTVVCHYRGTLIDGTEFDSSYKRGEPTSFTVTGVIKGWTEALLMMPVGSKWKLVIPSDLAYGERGNRNIGPNSALQFDIELISIKDPAEAAATPAPGAVSKPIQIQPQIKPQAPPATKPK
jgi:FKBP-type peptidyl-prolyl cis-trans isomerase